jgi:hypothetical protein
MATADWLDRCRIGGPMPDVKGGRRLLGLCIDVLLVGLGCPEFFSEGGSATADDGRGGGRVLVLVVAPVVRTLLLTLYARVQRTS